MRLLLANQVGWTCEIHIVNAGGNCCRKFLILINIIKEIGYLMNWGIGRVLSKPSATNPSRPTKSSERPNIRNTIDWHKLKRSSARIAQIEQGLHERGQKLDVLWICWPLPEGKGSHRADEGLCIEARSMDNADVQKSKLARYWRLFRNDWLRLEPVTVSSIPTGQGEQFQSGSCNTLAVSKIPWSEWVSTYPSQKKHRVMLATSLKQSRQMLHFH